MLKVNFRLDGQYQWPPPRVHEPPDRKGLEAGKYRGIEDRRLTIRTLNMVVTAVIWILLLGGPAW